MKWAVPRYGKDFAGGRYVFVYDLSGGSAELMEIVGRRAGDVRTGLKVRLVILHAGSVATQSSGSRQRERQ